MNKTIKLPRLNFTHINIQYLDQIFLLGVPVCLLVHLSSMPQHYSPPSVAWKKTTTQHKTH